MIGGTLLILGHGVKGQGQLWHSNLWTQYRLKFKFNHFQTAHVSCRWWGEEHYWFWVTGSHRVKGQVQFCPLARGCHALRCLVMTYTEQKISSWRRSLLASFWMHVKIFVQLCFWCRGNLLTRSSWVGLFWRFYVGLTIFKSYRNLDTRDTKSPKLKERGPISNPGPLAPQAKSLTTLHHRLYLQVAGIRWITSLQVIQSLGSTSAPYHTFFFNTEVRCRGYMFVIKYFVDINCIILQL